MNITADDKVDLNTFRKRWNDWWHLENMSMQDKYNKKIRIRDAYW